MTAHTILVVEDDLALREALCDTLELNGFEVVEASSGEAGVARLNDSSVDFVVSDVNMPGIDGHEFLAITREKFPKLPVLLITAYGSVSKAVDAIQSGAVDYLVKPFEPGILIETIQKFMKADKPVNMNEPVAVEPSSQQVLDLAKKVAKTDSTILISGESGTGKEVLARYIHENSNRIGQPFVAINCAAIPENMLEATLFGHEKGAFTGAMNSSPGKFEQANNGTILLDEISEMDLGLQAKLLRVLQEREVERIGGRKTIQLNVRVLATTNRNLLEEVKKGTFREDLYYRLSVFPIQWKPLRERRLDLIPLAERLIHIHAVKMGKADVRLDDSARNALIQYSWPGNVRELDNAIQRAMILQSGAWITDMDLGLVDLPELDFEPQRNQELFGDTAEVSNRIEKSNSELGSEIKQRELEIIIETIRTCGGRKKQAAERLGISPRTLRYKLARFRELGVDVDRAIFA
ncbi:sigma-54-dependent transcriptional regulator [Gynuella sp.]|uniref:sigma-54-dependent transcriptional regulator n=1 Tax=Gynuella sp. TaxID=2969146 RepID=UPI003D0F028F